MFSADLGWTVAEDRARPKSFSTNRRNALRSSSTGTIKCSQSARTASQLALQTSSSQRSLLCEKSWLARNPSCDGTTTRKGCSRSDRAQEDRFSSLAVPRRRRLVEQTLEIVRNSFDPAEGLEAAAAAAAEEVLFRSQAEQHAVCTSLAKPREMITQPLASDEPGPIRTLAEQQALCEKLAVHREAPMPPTPKTPAGPAVIRSTEEQQQFCKKMAQPRVREDMVGDDDHVVFLRQCRVQLGSRAHAPVPEDVAAARELLTQMRLRARNGGDGTSSRPSSALARSPSSAACCENQNPEIEGLVCRLRSIVEEVLWVVLLQIRSVPKPKKMDDCGRAGAELEDRLGNLLVSAVGATLRPIARKVLGPGIRIARQIRSEFPRLAVHLGFRESDDLTTASINWSAQEITMREHEVRACLDNLLAMDLTKTAMQGNGM